MLSSDYVADSFTKRPPNSHYGSKCYQHHITKINLSKTEKKNLIF